MQQNDRTRRRRLPQGDHPGGRPSEQGHEAAKLAADCGAFFSCLAVSVNRVRRLAVG